MTDSPSTLAKACTYGGLWLVALRCARLGSPRRRAHRRQRTVAQGTASAHMAWVGIAAARSIKLGDARAKASSACSPHSRKARVLPAGIDRVLAGVPESSSPAMAYWIPCAPVKPPVDPVQLRIPARLGDRADIHQLPNAVRLQHFEELSMGAWSGRW